MIVKILSSAKNFAGISYSERKNEGGESELLCAENFEGLGLQTNLSRADYINYMKAVAALNSRVKNMQFHAVISVNGKTASADELRQIGEQYLEKMGYGKNPYLIYHHDDTDNTHIHLVSTRVDKSGRKVDDSYEKLRSQKVMHEILSRDPIYEAAAALSNAMKYNFSTEAQFKLLLELKGFKITEKGNSKSDSKVEWTLIKYGVVQRKIDPEEVQKCTIAFKKADKRAAQLKAIFLKYAVGLSEDQWTRLLKDKFGLDLVFHRKEGIDIPYGYTIVDHPQKNVWKGSQILRLSELYAKAREDKVRQLIHELANNPGTSFHSLQTELRKLGFKLNQNGEVSTASGMVSLTPKQYHQLKYADRLDLASSFKINHQQAKSVLRKLLLVNPSDMQLSVGQKDFEALKAVVDYLDQSDKWEQGLKHFDLHLLKDMEHIYLLSSGEPALLEMETLMGRNVNIAQNNIQEVAELVPEHASILQQSSRGNLLAALIDVMAASQQQGQEQKNKKKHQQTFKY
jgi:hypothetical protein